MRLSLQPRVPEIGEGDLADKDVADGIDNRAEAQTGDALQHTWGSGAVRDHGMDIFNINLSVPFITRSRSSVQQISVYASDVRPPS